MLFCHKPEKQKAGSRRAGLLRFQNVTVRGASVKEENVAVPF